MDRLEKMILFNLLIIVMILTSPLKQRQQCVALTVDGAQCSLFRLLATIKLIDISEKMKIS
jgi:hypothetical protein